MEYATVEYMSRSKKLNIYYIQQMCKSDTYFLLSLLTVTVQAQHFLNHMYDMCFYVIFNYISEQKIYYLKCQIFEHHSYIYNEADSRE